MTSSPMRRKSAGLALGPALRIGGLYVEAIPAFVPSYFSWSVLAVCHFLHGLEESR
jgi:hypothetical protein